MNSKIIDNKLKPLSPTLRLKKRFIKIKINTFKNNDFNKISKRINEDVLKYLGIIDFGKSGFWILKDSYNKKESTIILKISTKYKTKLLSILAILNLETIKVSGNLKQLKQNNQKRTMPGI